MHCIRLITILSLLIIAMQAFNIYAQSLNDSDVLISREETSLTIEDVDSYLLTIPENQRQQFLASKKRVLELIGNLLDSMTLYDTAVEKGITEREDIRAEIEKATLQIVNNALIADYVNNNMLDDYSALAYEHYLKNKSQYVQPETVTVKHVLVANRTRSNAEALKQAKRIRSMIFKNEISFDEAVAQYSDDPSKQRNAGLLKNIARGDTHPAFERVAFTLNSDNALSDIVETPFGVHIIKFVKRNDSKQQAYEDVKDEIINTVKSKHRETLSKNYFKDLIDQSKNTLAGPLWLLLEPALMLLVYTFVFSVIFTARWAQIMMRPLLPIWQ